MVLTVTIQHLVHFAARLYSLRPKTHKGSREEHPLEVKVHQIATYTVIIFLDVVCLAQVCGGHLGVCSSSLHGCSWECFVSVEVWLQA